MSAADIANNILSVATFIGQQLKVLKTNIKQAKRLSERLEKIGNSLLTYQGDANSNFKLHAVGLKNLLDEIKKYIEKISSKSYFVQLVMGGSVTDHFEDFSAQLKAHCDDLQIAGMVELQNWVNENKEDARGDEVLLSGMASEIEKNGDRISALMGTNQAEIVHMMNHLYEQLDQGLYNSQKVEKDIAVAIANAMQNFTRRKGLPTEDKSTIRPEWVVESNMVTFMEEIGGGGFAVVYKGRYENSEVAIKKFKQASKEDIQVIFQEAKIWQSLRHNNVLQLIGACLDPESPFLISPLCYHGTMKAYLKKKDYPVDLGVKYMYQIAAGMGYLHSRNIIHNDLKALNVLIDKAEDAKVSDFGTSAVKKVTTAGKTTFKAAQVGGTQRWMAPERLKDEDLVTKASDVYSYAMTCFEIVSCGKIPFEKITDDLLRERIVEDQKKLPKPQTLTTYEGKADFIWNLIMECSSYEPETRPRFSSIVIKLEPKYQELAIEPMADGYSPSPGRQSKSTTTKPGEESIVSLQLKNLEARSFWTRKIGDNKVSTSWTKFYDALCDEFADLKDKDNEPETQLLFDRNKDGTVTLAEVRAATEKKTLTEIIDSVKIMTPADKFIEQAEAKAFWINNFGTRRMSMDWLLVIELLSLNYKVNATALQNLFHIDSEGHVTMNQWNCLTREHKTIQAALDRMELSDPSIKLASQTTTASPDNIGNSAKQTTPTQFETPSANMNSISTGANAKTVTSETVIAIKQVAQTADLSSNSPATLGTSNAPGKPKSKYNFPELFPRSKKSTELKTLPSPTNGASKKLNIFSFDLKWYGQLREWLLKSRRNQIYFSSAILVLLIISIVGAVCGNGYC